MNRRERIEFLKKNKSAQELVGVVSDVQLIYKRVILGIIIFVLFILLLLDVNIIKQTIKAKDYSETTAEYVSKKDSSNDSISDYIYAFEDQDGNREEIVLSIDSKTEPKEKIKIKYNEKNPKEYYAEGSLMTKNNYILFIIKIVLMISFIGLFLNTNTLRRTNISSNHKLH